MLFNLNKMKSNLKAPNCSPNTNHKQVQFIIDSPIKTPKKLKSKSELDYESFGSSKKSLSRNNIQFNFQPDMPLYYNKNNKNSSDDITDNTLKTQNNKNSLENEILNKSQQSGIKDNRNSNEISNKNLTTSI